MGMSHAFYVYSSWGIGAVTLIAIVAHTWLDGVRLKRELARLDAQGVRRRSAKPGGAEA
jgi:heme exporter protein D